MAKPNAVLTQPINKPAVEGDSLCTLYTIYIFMVDVFGHADTSILSINWVITSIADLYTSIYCNTCTILMFTL